MLQVIIRHRGANSWRPELRSILRDALAFLGTARGRPLKFRRIEDLYGMRIGRSERELLGERQS